MAISQTAFSIRPVEDGELEAWLALRNRGFPWATNRERFLFSESLRPADEPVLYLGAWTPDRVLAATAECALGEEGERYVDRAESFIMVDPKFRRAGLGGRLALEAERFAAAHGVRWLEALFYERDQAIAKPFLEGHGFSELERYETSWQQPSAVSLGDLEQRRSELRRIGIETADFAEIDSEAARRALYRCEMAIVRDMPHEPLADWHDAPYATWIRKVLDAPGTSAEAMFVARDGDQIVGLTYLVARGNGDAEVGDTGVVASHRRRGIALVLKMMATRYAAARGIRRVQTDNRADNVGMLTINRKLGFVPDETILIFAKTINQ